MKLTDIKIRVEAHYTTVHAYANVVTNSLEEKGLKRTKRSRMYPNAQNDGGRMYLTFRVKDNLEIITDDNSTQTETKQAA